jgi:hypothetical protein
MSEHTSFIHIGVVFFIYRTSTLNLYIEICCLHFSSLPIVIVHDPDYCATALERQIKKKKKKKEKE